GPGLRGRRETPPPPRGGEGASRAQALLGHARVRSSASREEPCLAKRSFGAWRCQAELGNENLCSLSPRRRAGGGTEAFQRKGRMMLLDFGLTSLLLVVAQLLRARVRLLHDLWLPAPLLAGLLGLAGGRQGLAVLPFQQSATGEPALADYPGQLIVVLFATLFLGDRPKGSGLRGVVREVGDTFFYNLAAEIGQFGAALAFGLLVLAPLFSGLPDGFALMLPAGFAGGHGTATVVGEALEQGGWAEATSVGYTFATLGLLAGIFGGMVLINVGVRRGWTRLVQSAQELSEVERRGFVPDDRQRSLGRETVSPAALDPLAWHLALALVAFAAAHLVNHLARKALPGNLALPLFAVAMLAGAGLPKAPHRMRVGPHRHPP